MAYKKKSKLTKKQKTALVTCMILLITTLTGKELGYEQLIYEALGLQAPRQVQQDKISRQSDLPAPPITQQDVQASVDKFVDGDTTRFVVAGDVYRARYLLIDAPELKKRHPYAHEAAQRVEELLSQAKQIRLEYEQGNRQDKYGRQLVYVFADDVLVQERLVEEGLARVAYVYQKKARYLDRLYQAEARAKAKQLKIWSIPGYVTDRGYNMEAVKLKE